MTRSPIAGRRRAVGATRAWTAAVLLGLCVRVSLGGPAQAAEPVAVAAIGDLSPLGLPFSRFSDAAVDDRGQVAFIGSSAGIFHRAGGGLGRIVAAGDPLGAGIFAAVGAPALGADGCVAFQAAAVGGAPRIVRLCTGVLDSLATVGDAAPGGGTFLGFGTEVAIGRDDQVAFTALLDDRETGLFRADGDGTIHEVTRTGRGSPVGGTFVILRLAGVSGAGQVGFRAQVNGGGDGLFLWNGTSIGKLAVVEDLSPAGGKFTAFGAASVSDADVWTFRATVVRPSDTVDGVFRADASGPTPVFGTVVVEGAPSPAGGTFRELPTSLVPTINATGTVAFRATLADATASAGIFVAAPGGAPAVVALVGDVVASSQLRRLRDPAIADDGSILFPASLATGATGLFVARDNAVQPFALLGDATDVGVGFRFSDPAVRTTAESGVFLGLEDAIYVSEPGGSLRTLAKLGGPTPLGGSYVGFDTPSGGPGGRIVFGASLLGGRAGEAIVSAGGRTPAALARTRQRVPGGGELVDLFTETVDTLTRVGVGAGGAVFNAALGRTSANAGVFLAGGGRLRALARAGGNAAGGKLVAFGTPASVGGGQAAFVAQVRGGESGTVLLRTGGGRARTLAAVGADTATRLASRYKSLDAPVAAGSDIVFRATLAQSGLEGLFLARGRRLVAVAGSGDPGPDGGHFRTFATPTLAGGNVVFLATVGGDRSGRGVYRVAEPRRGRLQDAPVAATAVVLAGDPSPLGGTFLDFSGPSGNPHDALAFSADLLGARAPGGVFLVHDTERSFP